ncbi:hypothetical protein [Flammeovirga kamogawensis]|nr:hypothetical protein [Flammeovirga kamogawensis]
MNTTKKYKKLMTHLFTIWVALHTLNYSVDIDAVLFSQVSYSIEQEQTYDNKVESFVELFADLFFDQKFDGFEDNPFSQNESKSVIAKVFFNLPVINIINDYKEEILLKNDEINTFYLDFSYPTPVTDIIPPPPRVS